jgi:hypothetical protein
LRAALPDLAGGMRDAAGGLSPPMNGPDEPGRHARTTTPDRQQET